ncbi:hypothetical protein V5E38_14230 [Rossellomorea sp. GAMAL-10_SWC]
MIDWNFPLNNDGPEVGLNDAGIETFKGRRLEALAREINQNSCDAKQKKLDKPVEIHYSKHDIPITDFPGLDTYKDILKSCIEHWSDIDKTRVFFKKALDIMDANTISILKISDYNTDGLKGSKVIGRSSWNSLIKAIGVSNKESNAGGSFGIGKNAPFACSALRTVFYGTKDIDGNYAFQGKTILATHKKNGELTQGTGYFGKTEKNRPIFDSEVNLPNIYKREKIGTDLFVMGFNGEENWESEIIKSVLENFLIAIFENQLVVKVGEIKIDKSNLPSLLEKYTKEDNDCLSYFYYKALVYGKIFEGQIQGFDELKLYLLEGKEFPKRIAMVRGTGMKIYDKGRFQGLTRFIGVTVAKGVKINEFLRLIEPPSHDKWEPERYEENPAYAKKVIKSLNNWISEQVKSINSIGSVEKLEIDGISQYLPDDDLSYSMEYNDNKRFEDKPDIPKEVEVYEETIKIDLSAKQEITVSIMPTEEINEDKIPGNEGQTAENSSASKHRNNFNTEDDSPENDDLKNTRDQNEGTKNNKDDDSLEPPLTLNAVRSFCINPKIGKYQISFTPSRNGRGHLLIKIIGEQGEEQAKIKLANKKNDINQINIVSSNRIGPFSFDGGEREHIEIELEDPIRCALGVTMYEDK